MRSFSGSVSKTWNSINPATLSGAIDVVVVEQEDGNRLPFYRSPIDYLIVYRHSRLLPFSCQIWEILFIETI